MTRDAMLAMLHELSFAYVDYLPDADFTERPLWVNAKGYGYLSCDDPSDCCWDGKGLNPEKWLDIRTKLVNRNLLLSDLDGTSLLELLDVMYCDNFPEDEDPSEYLEGLLSLTDEPPAHIYCMNSVEGWQFFATEVHFKEAYERDWCDYAWEELSDEILAVIIRQLIDDGILNAN